tara:strand:- start:209 stop:571 length:363 start_codon:yes stop_codon:yes gene_type:complete
MPKTIKKHYEYKKQLTDIHLISLTRIEIDPDMLENIKINPCFISHNSSMGRITKLKRVVKNIIEKNPQQPVSVKREMLYTPPSERRRGEIRYKYRIKKGRTLVAASINAKMTHIPCYVEI